MINIKHDNTLLVEFEFVADLDLAAYRYIKNEYPDAAFVDHEFISLDSENEVIYRLIHRIDENPFSIIIPGQDTSKLYEQIISNKTEYSKLLHYATPYDTYRLMLTYLENASSVEIFILCQSDLEANLIKAWSKNRLNTIISKKRDVDLTNYTAMYVKYISELIKYNYNQIKGKHIYIPTAKFIMKPDMNMIKESICAFTDVNIVHIMDLYKNIKYRYESKGDSDV